ncbi:MAG: hypothetical protein OQK04_09280, partial [Kangiellaceae bacterium]|nr:hypothetical protein [Kangiellaceae bacterium]
MRIELLSPESAKDVDLAQWQTLAQNSINVNPFFEHWSLLPALKWFTPNEDVFLVTAYQKDTLVALFPIQIESHKIGIRFIKIWCHDHCFLSDALYLSDVAIEDILIKVMRRLKVSTLKIDLHSRSAYGRLITQNSFVFESSRGAVFNPETIEPKWQYQAGKVRKENKRIVKRFYQSTDATYVTSKQDPEKEWLLNYCQLEHSGWKRIKKGSILSDINTYNYYKELVEQGVELERVEFQGLVEEHKIFAISFRIVSRNIAFELKTTFAEDFRQLYPGVILELENLQAMDFAYVDSCTTSSNYLINRLWPDQKVVCT